MILKMSIIFYLKLLLNLLFFYNEPELGVGSNPGMALTPLPSSMGLNPRSSDCEPSALPLDHGFRLLLNLTLESGKVFF